MFKKGDFLLDQNNQFTAYVMCVGEIAYFLKVINIETKAIVEQLVEKPIVEKRFYLSLEQEERGKILYLNSSNHVCEGVPEAGV